MMTRDGRRRATTTLLLHGELERDEGKGDVQEVRLLTLDAWVRSVGAEVDGNGGELARSTAAGVEEIGRAHV